MKQQKEFYIPPYVEIIALQQEAEVMMSSTTRPSKYWPKTTTRSMRYLTNKNRCKK